MNEQFGRVNGCEGYRPHAGRFLHLLVPLGIGFMLGMHKARLHRGFGPGKSWENGVPPFFAELHRRAHAASEGPEVTEA
jgi:hypothetical protein